MKDKHSFSSEYNKKKSALMSALEDETIVASEKCVIAGFSKRMICIVAAAILLTVSVCAAAKRIDFSIFNDGEKNHIHAGLTEPADSDDPLRSWTSDDNETSIRLVFDSMARDLTEDLTANGKWGGADNSRAITFSGYDLRRCDFDSVIGDTESAEAFYAGGNRAYIIRNLSETAIYNKTIFVLFEEEEMVIKATVTFGISEEEIKGILSGMRIEETDDVSLALPISNVFSNSDIDIPDEITLEERKIYYKDLKKIGEGADYAFGPEGETPWIKYTLKVEDFEIRDGFDGLAESAIENKEFIQRFTDQNGYLIPYKRTEVVYDKDRLTPSFGVTVEMTKRLVLVTVRLENYYDIDENPPELWLRSYNLYDFEVDADGIVKKRVHANYVIDRTPGTYCRTSELVYNEDLGGGLYRLGYILDEDQLSEELLLTGCLTGSTPDINFLLG